MVEVSCRSADVLMPRCNTWQCHVGDGMQVEMQLLLYEYQHALIMFSLNCQDCHVVSQSPCEFEDATNTQHRKTERLSGCGMLPDVRSARNGNTLCPRGAARNSRISIVK